MLSYSDALHADSMVQLLSDVSVSRVEMYWVGVVAVSQVRASTHTRSEVSVGCAVLYCSLVHEVMVEQARFEVAVDAVDSYCSV